MRFLRYRESLMIYEVSCFFFLRCTFISVNDIRRFRDACVRVRVLCEEASSFVRLTDCSRSSRCSSAMRSFVWMSDCAHVPYHRLMTLRQSTSTYLAYLPWSAQVYTCTRSFDLAAATDSRTFFYSSVTTTESCSIPYIFPRIYQLVVGVAACIGLTDIYSSSV